MPIATLEEIQQYQPLRISSVTPSERLTASQLKKLQTIEQKLISNGYEHGLAYYVAYNHNICGIGLIRLKLIFCTEKQEISETDIKAMLDYHGIPRLKRADAWIGYKRNGDPEFRKRYYEAIARVYKDSGKPVPDW